MSHKAREVGAGPGAGLASHRWTQAPQLTVLEPSESATALEAGMVTLVPVAALVTGVVVPAAATASVMSCRRLQDQDQGAGSRPR